MKVATVTLGLIAMAIAPVMHAETRGARATTTTPTSFRVQVVGKGRPMILIPGLMSSGETWNSTVARYQDRFECHVLTLAGFAGSLKVFVAQNASLTDVHWTMSGEIVLMTLVGGLGTVFGPVVGAFVIIAMQQYLAGFGQWVTVIQGVIFVICVLAFRRGVVGEIAHLLRIKL